MNVFITLLCEFLHTKLTLERLDVFVDQQMVFETTFSRKLFTTAFELAKQKLSRSSGAWIEHLQLIVPVRFFHQLQFLRG